MESRILQLIGALRASGVRVSLAESAEAFSAVDLMGIQHREHFRLSLRTTLIKDVRDLPIFDKLFPLFFGNGQPPPMGGNPTDDMTPEEAQQFAEALRQFAQSLRQRMERLMNGEQLSRQELEALAQMVGLNQAGDLRHQQRHIHPDLSLESLLHGPRAARGQAHRQSEAVQRERPG